MIGLLCFVVAVLASPFRSKIRLEVENAALRHQLVVLRRKLKGRPRVTRNDRWFFVQLYRWFPSILPVLMIMRPETLVRWHRAGFRRDWRWKSRRRGGRPPIGAELRALVRQMSTENLLWGAPRIDGGLLTLGFDRFVGAGKQRRRDDRMKRRLPPSARPSVMSAAIFETGPKATTTPVAPAVPRVFAFSMQAAQSIVVDPKSPGGINLPHGLILFDGVCVLCSRGCRFVSKRDRRGYFRSVPIQSADGRPLAEQLGIDPDHPGSFWRATWPM